MIFQVDTITNHHHQRKFFFDELNLPFKIFSYFLDIIIIDIIIQRVIILRIIINVRMWKIPNVVLVHRIIILILIDHRNKWQSMEIITIIIIRIFVIIQRVITIRKKAKNGKPHRNRVPICAMDMTILTIIIIQQAKLFIVVVHHRRKVFPTKGKCRFCFVSIFIASFRPHARQFFKYTNA